MILNNKGRKFLDSTLQLQQSGELTQVLMLMEQGKKMPENISKIDLLKIITALCIGKPRPDRITKSDLTKIIAALCKKLNFEQENECHIELQRLKIGQEKQGESGEESIKEFIDPLDDNLLDIDSSRIEENTNENVQKQTEGLKDSDTSPLFNENTKDEEKSTKECHDEETIDVLGGSLADINSTTMMESPNESVQEQLQGLKESGRLQLINDVAKDKEKSTKGFHDAMKGSKVENVKNIKCKEKSFFSCPHCNKKYISISKMESHKLTHTMIPDSTNEDNAQRKDLEMDCVDEPVDELESNIKSENKKTFECPECNRRFCNKNEFEKHKQAHNIVDLSLRPFNCSQCLKRFTEYRSLKIHELIHSGRKPFQCSVCGKKFTQVGHLKRHEKIHTGDKPFSCSKCDKKFIERKGVIVHERTHTGDRPFSCSKCDKRFTTNQNMQKHLKKCETIKS